MTNAELLHHGIRYASPEEVRPMQWMPDVEEEVNAPRRLKPVLGLNPPPDLHELIRRRARSVNRIVEKPASVQRWDVDPVNEVASPWPPDGPDVLVHIICARGYAENVFRSDLEDAPLLVAPLRDGPLDAHRLS